MNVQMSYNFIWILPKIGSSTSEKKYISTSIQQKKNLIQQKKFSVDGTGSFRYPSILGHFKKKLK